MTESSKGSRERAGRSQRSQTLLGAIVVLLLPILVLLDTARASASGWRAGSSLERAVFVIAGAVVVAVISVLVFARGRRWLGALGGRLALAVVASALSLYTVECSVARARSPAESFRRFHRKAPHTRAVFRPDPELMPGIEGDSHYTTNELGLRSPSRPPQGEARRILCVGGSTTICQYLDDTETWTQRLEAELCAHAEFGRAWIGNVGKNGYSTFHHLHLLRTVEQRGDHDLFDGVEFVLYLVGINDLGAGLQGRTPKIRAGVPPQWRRSALAEWFFAVVRTSAAKGELQVEDQAGAVYAARRASRQRARRCEEAPDLSEALGAYRSRIGEIAELTRSLGAEPVFVSQPVLWTKTLAPEHDALLWFGQLADGRYLSAAELARSMAQFNQATKEVCEHRGAAWIDLSAMNGVPEFYYDDCHFSEVGAAEVARRIAAALFEPR